MKKSPTMFQNVIGMLYATVSIAETCRKLEITEASYFSWQQASRKAMASGDTSEFYFDYEGRTDWFHVFCKAQLSASIAEVESALRLRAARGTTVETRYMGRTIYKIDPDYEDEGLRDLFGLTSKDKYLRVNGKLVPETQWLPPSSSEVQLVLQSYLPKYKKQSSVDVSLKGNITGGVMVMNRPAPVVAAPLPVLQIVDAVTDTVEDGPETEQPDAVDVPSPEREPEPIEDALVPEERERVITDQLPNPYLNPTPRANRSLSPLERDLLDKLKSRTPGKPDGQQ